MTFDFMIWHNATAMSMVKVVSVNASDTPNSLDATVTIACSKAKNRITIIAFANGFMKSDGRI